MKLYLFIKQFVSANLRRSEDRFCTDGYNLDLTENRIQITPLKEAEEASKEEESNLDLRALAFRQESIGHLKGSYSKLCLAIAVLSVVSGLFTLVFYRSAHMDKRYLVKVGFVVYQPIVASLFIYALGLSKKVAYGRSMSQLKSFDYFGCQLILCLMAVDFFWIIAGLTGYMADPTDWLSLFLLVIGMFRAVLYGKASIASDRLVILCTVNVAPRMTGGISSFDRI